MNNSTLTGLKPIRWGALIALCVTLLVNAPAQAQQTKPCESPKTVRGFETCADVSKAIAEGNVTIYSVDQETGLLELLQAFTKLFPEIKTSYVTSAMGPLHAKIVAERQAGTYSADIISYTDMGLARDFQKRNGFSRYMSPQLPYYKKQFKSEPEGFFTAGGLMIGGIAYSPKFVKPEEAPKSWKDLLDPKWANVINVRASTSGQQHLVWYALDQQYGKDYFTKFAKQNPRPFVSCGPQFERLINGQDKIAASFVYLCYLTYKARGADINFIVPDEGTPTGFNVYGAVGNAPHPEASKLFLDWYLSKLGGTAFVKALRYIHPREDVAPPPGSLTLSELKVVIPKDWEEISKTQAEFLRTWNAVTGRP